MGDRELFGNIVQAQNPVISFGFFSRRIKSLRTFIFEVAKKLRFAVNLFAAC